MSASRGLRIVLVGATGALGQELREVLASSSLPIAELMPVATDASIGSEIEFRGEPLFVEPELPALRGYDLVLLCTPAAASLELVREALRAEVPCIDCSGVLGGSVEVPLAMHDWTAAEELAKPVTGVPLGATLGLVRVLAALDATAGLERVVATLVHPAAHAGRAGIEALSAETIALLSQAEPPDPEVFPGPVAFDCVPGAQTLASAGPGDLGATALEERIAGEVKRLLGGSFGMAVTCLQVPTFLGEGASLAIETREPLSVEDAMAALEKAARVELWAAGEGAPSTRDTAGREDALVGRVRRDPSRENGLLVWLAVDGLRLVASEVVALAEARFRLS
jgi:aspartate-semialdehyde dehydrogenase